MCCYIPALHDYQFNIHDIPLDSEQTEQEKSANEAAID